MVQQELHPSDEGREGHGDPGEPRADEAAPGVPEVVADAEAPPPVLSLTPTDPPPAGPVPQSEALVASPAPTLEVTDIDPVPQSEALVAAPAPNLEVTDIGPVPQSEALVASPASYLEVADSGISHVPAAPGGHALMTLTVWRDEIIAWFKTLASAAVYATLIVTFGFQVARVEGQSMAPTLEDQDRLIVNKLAYRMGEPRRGDIVMLYYPVNPDKSFVKRVIAEEGDEVRIVGGKVFVKMPSGYEVQLPDDFVPPEYQSHEDYPPELVKDGYYFVMGDHRNNSSDSRHWGQVPKKYIIGKVQLRWWPIPNARVF